MKKTYFLTPEQINLIRKLRKDGMLYKEIAWDIRCSISMVQMICSGKRHTKSYAT